MPSLIGHLKVRLWETKDNLLKIPVVNLIYRTIEELGETDAAYEAASVAYYAILSIFPLLLGLIAAFGFFLPSVNLQDQLLNYVGTNIPGATDILKQNIANIIELRGAMTVLSIAILFWGASAMFSAISLAINRAWGIHRYRRSFFIRKGGELGMVFCIGILFLLSLGARAIISILRGVSLPVADPIIANLGSWLVAFLLMLVVFLLLYKLIPNTETYWRDIWPGALLAAILFEIARTLFIFYLENFTHYQLLYGSIVSIIALLIWIYYSAFIMILGAEFTFQYSRMRHPPTTGGSTDS